MRSSHRPSEWPKGNRQAAGSAHRADGLLPAAGRRLEVAREAHHVKAVAAASLERLSVLVVRLGVGQALLADAAVILVAVAVVSHD